MKHELRNWTAVTALGLFGLAGIATGQDISPQEREKGLRYLMESRNEVTDAVKGLSEAQWRFKPASDRWSIAEIVEHLDLTEGLIRDLLRRMPQAAVAPAGRDVKAVDESLVSKMVDRSTKAQAPAEIVPSGHMAPREALDQLLSRRAEVADLLQTGTDLRGHVIPHPLFGPLDSYEWILAVAAHSERHTKQIIEVKSDPHFPAN